MKGNVPWCFVCQFPDRDKFILGHTVLDADAQQHEIEEAGFALMDRLLPTRPDLVDMQPGQIFFVPHDNERDQS